VGRLGEQKLPPEPYPQRRGSMKVLIVYESFFGNTEKIALAMSKALGAHKVGTVRASEVKPERLAGLGLLLVGSPTRAFRPTKAVTSFLNSIPRNGLNGVRVAAFDTRNSEADINSRLLKVLVSVFGYAAKPISDKLVKKGGVLVIPPEGFFVKGSEGPLKEGELERAAGWARKAASAGQ